MQPYVGQIVLYCLRPGQVHAGQSELAAIVTRVRRLLDGETVPCVDLRIWRPDMVDPLVQQNVMAQSAAVRGHCWQPTEALAGRVTVNMDAREKAEIRGDIAKLSDQVVELAAIVTEPAKPAKRAATAR